MQPAKHILNLLGSALSVGMRSWALQLTWNLFVVPDLWVQEISFLTCVMLMLIFNLAHSVHVSSIMVDVGNLLEPERKRLRQSSKKTEHWGIMLVSTLTCGVILLMHALIELLK